MTITPSDASSLAQSLTHWEWAEYVACAFVAIACAGEYVASFTDWFTAGAEPRKRRLEKRSTLLLIVSLSVELFCLVQTNSISGQLIGSLSDKATNAERKAQSALDKSVGAETKAGEAGHKSVEALTRAHAAEDSLAEAEADARKAQVAAASALATATNASNRAGRAEAYLGKAEAEAKDAQAASSNALDLAREARGRVAEAKAQLTLLTTNRSLTNVLALIAALQPFGGTQSTFTGIFGDEESENLAAEICGALQKAGWKPVFAWNTGFGNAHIQLKDCEIGSQLTTSTGVHVDVEADEAVDDINKLPLLQKPKQVQATIALKSALADSISPSQTDLASTELGIGPRRTNFTPVVLTVGKKP
jgi:hypothetical protein